MLLVAASLMLAVLGVAGTALQPSALRVAVTAVVGLLAPLFWPGIAATPARTALRIAAWSAAAAGTAAMALLALGNPAQPFSRILGSCLMLLLILLPAHAVAAALEAGLRGPSMAADSAREMAGRAVACTLALLGSLPLWFGPAAELLSRHHPWIIDAMLGISPLTHLAVASDNDLLRNQWLYQHSNLASLQFSYPGLAAPAWTYAALCGVLALIVLALRQAHRPGARATRTQPTQEQSK